MDDFLYLAIFFGFLLATFAYVWMCERLMPADQPVPTAALNTTAERRSTQVRP
ncbi:hypothetical protein BH11PLA1_BH11PLA1_06110 [soil metagenome]